MASLNGVNYATTHAPSDGNWKLIPVAEVGGQVRMLYDSYTVVTATAINDILNVGRLLKDSRVWDVLVHTSGRVHASGTIDVGFAYDDSAIADASQLFIANATVQTTAGDHMGMTGGLALGTTSPLGTNPVSIAGEGIVQLTFKVGKPIAGIVVKVMVLYTID